LNLSKDERPEKKTQEINKELTEGFLLISYLIGKNLEKKILLTNK